MRDFNNSIDSLVKAFMKGTLNQFDCSRCAVGNIILGRLGADGAGIMSTIFYRGIERIKVNWGAYNSNVEGNNDISLNVNEVTGYSDEEIDRIERAFMRFQNNEQGHFEGLLAVVDVLADIHGIDLKSKEEAKLLFVKA